jgi:hypothetical protein
MVVDQKSSLRKILVLPEDEGLQTVRVIRLKVHPGRIHGEAAVFSDRASYLIQ